MQTTGGNEETPTDQLLQFYEFELRKLHAEKRENGLILKQQAETIAELMASNDALKQKHAEDLADIRKQHAAHMSERIGCIENEKQAVICAIRMAHEGMQASGKKRNRELEEEVHQLRRKCGML